MMKWMLLLLLGAMTAKADDVVLFYDASPSTNLVSYRLYYSSTTTTPVTGGYVINIPKTNTTSLITNLGFGLWFFQVTAMGSSPFGLIESEPTNTASYTNKHGGPLNLRIDKSTNNTAALWIENFTGNALVQYSGDGVSWLPWCSFRTYEPGAVSSLFVSGIAPSDAMLFRVAPPLPPPSTPPLPSGTALR